MTIAALDRTNSQLGKRDPWIVLESLLSTLTDATNSSKSIQATLEAVAEGVTADVAYWYSKANGKVLAMTPGAQVTPEWCAQFAQNLLKRIPETDEVMLWTNPPPSGENEPQAALLCRSTKAQGCIIALSHVPERNFDESDLKIARITLKMFLSQRAQSVANTKQLLLGLLHSLTTIIDAKDPYTAGHSERVARIATLMAKQMMLSPGQVSDVYLAGLLHDVGKIGVRDEVLQKPGKLTREELEEIYQHPVISERIVASIKPFDRLRGPVKHHHERWDGNGYPDRLGGEEIPILARILCVADACDAMLSARRYRPSRSPIEIDAILTREAGKQFDPFVVRAFMAIRHELYPPIYQKGLGESAAHAIDHIVNNITEATGIKLPTSSKKRLS